MGSVNLTSDRLLWTQNAPIGGGVFAPVREQLKLLIDLKRTQNGLYFKGLSGLL